MARFYFELREGDNVTPDDEGEQFVNLTEARSEAKTSLRELIAEEIKSAAPPRPRSITIRDEDKNVLAVVRLTATLEEEETPSG
jgi:hypothetical protein